MFAKFFYYEMNAVKQLWRDNTVVQLSLVQFSVMKQTQLKQLYRKQKFSSKHVVCILMSLIFRKTYKNGLNVLKHT